MHNIPTSFRSYSGVSSKGKKLLGALVSRIQDSSSHSPKHTHLSNILLEEQRQKDNSLWRGQPCETNLQPPLWQVFTFSCQLERTLLPGEDLGWLTREASTASRWSKVLVAHYTDTSRLGARWWFDSSQGTCTTDQKHPWQEQKKRRRQVQNPYQLLCNADL